MRLHHDTTSCVTSPRTSSTLVRRSIFYGRDPLLAMHDKGSQPDWSIIITLSFTPRPPTPRPTPVGGTTPTTIVVVVPCSSSSIDPATTRPYHGW